jgi:hypothetical protein
MTQSPINTFTFDPPADDRSSDMQDVCTWLLRVMDKDDRAVVFIASILQSFLKYGGLTERQAEATMDVFFRVLKQFNENRLNIQGCVVTDEPSEATNVVSLADTKRRK